MHTLSIVIPVYKNQDSIPELFQGLNELHNKNNFKLEVIFVVDGSPDQSALVIDKEAKLYDFKTKLILLSRNFGSFSAIRAGLSKATGEFVGVMAADLQEPTSLMSDFYDALKDGQSDIAVGVRTKREDSPLDKFMAESFWTLYKKFVQSEMPAGGVDVFAANRKVIDKINSLQEINSSLVGLLIWLGFRRVEVPYQRFKRPYGKSAWTFKKKLRYLTDSIFSFTDLPFRIMFLSGLIGILISIVIALTVIVAKIFGSITVPGYTATILISLFFFGLNSVGLSILGGYLWRTFENSKGRPVYIILSENEYS